MKCVQDVKDKAAAIAGDPSKCLNGSIIHHALQHSVVKGKKKGVAFTKLAEHLISCFSKTNVHVPRLISKLQSLMDLYRSLTKHVERNSSVILNFLNEEFEFPLDIPTEVSSPHTPVKRHANYDTDFPNELEFHVDIPEASSPHTPVKRHFNYDTEEPGSLGATSVATPAKTRRDCTNCSTSKKINVVLQKTLRVEKSKVHGLKTFTANVKKNLNIKGTKQKLSRREQKVKDLNQAKRVLEIKLQNLERKSRKFVDRCDSLSKDLNKLQHECEKLKKELAVVTDSVKEKDTELKECQRYCDHLELKLKDKSDDANKLDVLTTKSGKAYSSDIRRLVYHELVCDVPVKHCGYLLAAFAEVMCRQRLRDTPCPSTCAQMAYELGVLTTIQVMTYMLQQQNICLSWDATTIDGCHVNEIHLTSNKTNCLVLDVRHLAGGKTSDYVNHIVSALTEAADVYARYTDETQQQVFTALKSSIASTLTDRAAVNACVTRQLCDEFETHLILLNCNIHPLDSIARHAKQNLVKIDGQYDVKGNCYGSDGTAANLINAISVLRFKDGTGDPVGFKNMLRHHNLPAGTFVRYVGNRIHVLFHLAGVLVLHWSKVKEFIEMQSTAAGLLRSRLVKDLANEKIMTQVWALGMMGKLFSGPWMSKFYSSEMSNLDMRPFVKDCKKQLETWIKMPHSLLQPTFNVFGEPLCPADDEVLSTLQSYVTGEIDLQIDAIVAVLEACLTVIKKQLNDFLSEDDLPSETMDKASSAPTHNMASERTLGCVDKMLRRAPVATGGFVNGKVRSKMNKCTEWLDAQTAETQIRLIKFAIAEAREERVRSCVLDRAVDGEVAERRKAIADERRKKSKNSALKSINKAFKAKSVIDLECSDAVKDRITIFFEHPECLIGILFIHTVDGSEFYGRIQRFESTCGDEIVVGYWGFEEPESSSIDHTLSTASFFADALLGLVLFM